MSKVKRLLYINIPCAFLFSWIVCLYTLTIRLRCAFLAKILLKCSFLFVFYLKGHDVDSLLMMLILISLLR